MYCPSRVSPKGKFVKQISGNRTSGRNVPGICINSKIRDILIKGFMHIVIPIITSHQPNMGTKVLGSQTSKQYFLLIPEQDLIQVALGFQTKYI